MPASTEMEHSNIGGEMVDRKMTLVLLLLATALGMTSGQQIQVAPRTPTQTPRQAMIELLTGEEAAAKTHLTLEVQKQIAASEGNSAAGGMSLLGMMNMAKGAGGPEFQAFETGPILFSADSPKDRQRFELRVENDVVHGETADIDLSLHSFKDGQEESLPIGFHFLLGLKVQQNIWRLNTITFSVKLPVGDPRLFNPSTWNQSLMASRMMGASGIGGAPLGPEKIQVGRAVKMVGMAENVYLRKHPNSGFTCNLADLVNIGKGFDNGQPYTYLDSEFVTGTYNGYRFKLSGCDSSQFQVTAEPLSGSGKAYCSDASNTLRVADDGRGATCLASGRVTMR